MDNWSVCKITNDKKIFDAVKVIDSSYAKIALVVDAQQRLLGTVTDYDVRQAILNGFNLDSLVTTIMSSSPKVLYEEQNPVVVFSQMKNKNIKQLPVLDKNRKLVGLKVRCEFEEKDLRRSNPVLIMAGGLGMRLRPLTENCPKPMLKIGGKPILEIILENFIDTGFQQFYFSVNYRADIIRQYFGNGERYGIEINYLQETEQLGTAGALSLLPKHISETLIIMNGDLLTKVNFTQLLDFHIQNKAKATMCVREYTYQIPYGVVEFDKWNIVKLKEKPSYTSFVNAGIYVLEPEVFGRIAESQYLDMPDLFSQEIAQKSNVLIFPIREYWLDVGKIEDFERAQQEFE